MRNTILTILGSALLAASTIQFAAAAEQPHKANNVYRSPAPAADRYRNSNAYYPEQAPVQPGWSQYEDWQRYRDGALSAPAGH